MRAAARIETPSARVRERVRGRWPLAERPPEASERTFVLLKGVFGAPAALLMPLIFAMLFLESSAADLLMNLCCGLVGLYVVMDRLSKSRELVPFTLGSDFTAALLFFVIAVGGLMSGPVYLAEALWAFRWIPFAYIIAFGWELFPGLRGAGRMALFAVLFTIGLGVFQSLTGVAVVGDAPPVEIVSGLFRPAGLISPDAYGALLATFLPFALSLACLQRDRELRGLELAAALALVFITVAGLVLTFSAGIWLAGLSSLCLLFFFPAEGRLRVLGVFVAAVILTRLMVLPLSINVAELVGQQQTTSNEQLRQAIAADVSAWKESPWFGDARLFTELKIKGNLYFWILGRAGLFGLIAYLLFVLNLLLSTFRIFQEVPRSHHYHRVLISGAFVAQFAFHLTSLHWVSLGSPSGALLLAGISAMVGYIGEHYGHGLVPDDRSL